MPGLVRKASLEWVMFCLGREKGAEIHQLQKQGKRIQGRGKWEAQDRSIQACVYLEDTKDWLKF